jgi:tyrosyl-tRNA synthetase
MTDKKLREIIKRGVTNVIEQKSLESALKSGKKLRIKFGIDPTGPKVHLGHAITFWKLREFQDLGHKIVLIIGDYTAQIGDPSDKLAERQPLTEEDIKVNLKGYLEQIGKVIDLEKTEIRYNSEWHKKGSKADLIEEAMNFTVNQMLDRDNFQTRFKENRPIGLQEFLYPLLQGMDSVAVKSDVELGGNDQYFNLLAGRTLQKRYGQKPQDIMTFELLSGTDGRKMSKTYNNAIWISDEPAEMFGKVMSLKDELIIPYFIMATDVNEKEIEKIEKELKKGGNPRNAKVELGKAVVSRYYSEKEAREAQADFEQRFVKKEVPDNIQEVSAEYKVTLLVELLDALKMTSSKSEARRLIEQGGVKVDGAVIGDREAVIEPISGMVIQVGKRKFLRVK